MNTFARYFFKKKEFLQRYACFSCLIASFFCSFSQKNVLHYTETTGFDHGTREVSATMFEEIGLGRNFTLTQDNDGQEFNSLENLQRYSVVIFSNTSGANGLDEEQRKNFEQYIAEGGSYMGLHAASDTYRHSSSNGNKKGAWDWYAETVAGASVQHSPNHTSLGYEADMRFLSTDKKLKADLPDPWTKKEEWYYWEKGYLNPDFVTVLEVEQTGDRTYDAPRMAAHIRELPGGGKAFYSSLGHAKRNYESDEMFKTLCRNALVWILDLKLSDVEIQENELFNKLNPKIVNPVQRSIWVQASIDQVRDVSLDLYDLQGRHLKEFAITQVPKGELSWKNLIFLPQGLYIAKLKVDEIEVLSKMLLYQNP